MTPIQARQLILDEGSSTEGVVVLIRMGIDPGKDRMDQLLEALQLVFVDLSDQLEIDRELAYALFGLANHVEANINSWISQGKKWPDRLVDRELPELLMAVESIFCGEWLGMESDNDQLGGP